MGWTVKISKAADIIRWLRQPSTWQGIVLVLGILGINVRPDINTAILTACGLILGLISVLKDDGTNPPL